MSWAGSESAQIYLGQSRLGVWSPKSAEAGVQWVSTKSVKEGWSRGTELLREQGQPRRQRVTVWLSGALARPFMFEPVQGLGRWSEVLQVAARLAPDATGLAGPCDVWLAEWRPANTCVAVAVDSELRELIESSAKVEKWRLTAIRPWWMAALNEAIKNRDSTESTVEILAAEEPDALTVLSGSADISSAACYFPRPDAVQTDALLKRALMVSNIAPTSGRKAILNDVGLPRQATAGLTGAPIAPFGELLGQIA